MRVVFRVDASVQIGTGHVMRCLTLADALRERGAACRFVTRALPGHLGGMIEERGFELTLLDSPKQDAADIAGPPAHAAWAGVSWQHDMAETRDAIAQADWLILDHYAFDARWQQGVMDRVGRIMVIDDLADRPHRAALLLDQNLGRAGSDYDGLVPEDCRRLIGPHHALLRPEFAKLRETALAQRKARGLRRLMISMGGTDVADATSTVLRALRGAALPDDIRLSVVMGSRAPALARVRALAAQMPWPTEVLVDMRNMAALMADADLAIGAGGGTTWERCCLGLPSIIVETADNQAGAVAAMESASAAMGTGPLTDYGFGVRLCAAVASAARKLGELSSFAAQICDGAGSQRVAAALVGESLRIRKAEMSDAESIWHWRNHGGASAFYLDPTPTPLADHLAWFEGALASATRELMLVEHDGQPAAHVRIDRSSSCATAAEISIYLNPAFRGKGMSTSFLLAAINSPQIKPHATFIAKAHRENEPSIRLFISAGFERVSECGHFVLLRLAAPGTGSKHEDLQLSQGRI